MVYGADWAGVGWVLVVDVPIGLPETDTPGGRAALRTARGEAGRVPEVSEKDARGLEMAIPV